MFANHLLDATAVLCCQSRNTDLHTLASSNNDMNCGTLCPLPVSPLLALHPTAPSTDGANGGTPLQSLALHPGASFDNCMNSGTPCFIHQQCKWQTPCSVPCIRSLMECNVVKLMWVTIICLVGVSHHVRRLCHQPTAT